MEASCADAELKLLAFEHGDETTLIVINDSKNAKELTLPAGTRAVKLAVTDDDRDLAESIPADGQRIDITPRSVTTAVLHKGGR